MWSGAWGGESYIGKWLIIDFVVGKYILVLDRFPNNRERVDLKHRKTTRSRDTIDTQTHWHDKPLLSLQLLDAYQWSGPGWGDPPALLGGGELTPGAPPPPLPSVDSALCPSRYRIVRRGSTKTQTLCEQHTGLTARFPIFRRLWDSRIFYRLVKSGFSCASLVISAIVEMFWTVFVLCEWSVDSLLSVFRLPKKTASKVRY